MAHLSAPQGTPVIVLLGPVGVGKSLLATALAGLQLENSIFRVGDAAHAVTLEATSHRARWFGRQTEEEFILLDPPGVGDGDCDAARLANVVRIIRDFGQVSVFPVVLNSEQPRIGSVLQNLLRLFEECFGKRFWRHVVLVFTRYYTDPRSARRRGNKTREMMRQEFSSLLAAQFPKCLEERIPPGEAFPSYFVDSEAVVRQDLDEHERSAATLEMERFSVFARASPCLPTYLGSDSVPGGADNAEGLQREEEDVEELSLRSWVVVQNLVGTPSLNGAHGIIDEYQADKNRYVVEFANGNRKLIHAKNLRKIQDHEEQDALKKTTLPKEGDIAEICDLKKAASLNGQVCKVKSPKDADRFDVQLVDGSIKAVKTDNLKVLAEPGSLVVPLNVEQVKLVRRGPSWIWGEQDGGTRCVGRILDFNEETGWATVRWNRGRTNKYRVGVDGKHDLKCADPFSHEVECREALAKGGSAIRPWHLQCTFRYSCGVIATYLEYFDVREEICQALGGQNHGQRVQTPTGKQAVAIGVAPMDGKDSDRTQFFFHLDDAAGAGIFDGLDTREFKKLGRQKARELALQPSSDNVELHALIKEVTPTFQYVTGANSFAFSELGQFDIRDSICQKVGGLKHGQVVYHPGVDTATKQGVVIGVKLVKELPKLFVHLDGKPGAGCFEDHARHKFQVVGVRKVQQTPDNFLQAPEISQEVRDLTKSLQLTFSFPLGPHFARPGLFDVRDEVCLAVGGFRHGQVVEDHDGDRAVVVGVRCSEEDSEPTPKLWFRCDGNEGAGIYTEYHLVRKQFKVLGSRELHEVLPSDPMFQNQDPKKKKRGILKELLQGLHGLLEREHDVPIDEDFKDFEFDYSFRYLQKCLEPAMFDIRDEACMPVGGFKHGDMVECPGLMDPSVVIGVRPDRQGRARLWMHMEGTPGAGLFEHQYLIRMGGRVTGKKQVEEYQDPAPRIFSQDFIQGLQFTFRFPIGLGPQTQLGLFDIRDEVCLHVGECKHGERLKWDEMEMVAIGVAVDESLPEMFFQVVKPFRSPGAGTLSRLKAIRPFMEFLGQEVVEEILESGSGRGSTDSTSETSGDGFQVPSRSSSEEDWEEKDQHTCSEVKLCKSSEQGDESKSAGHAVLLCLSHTGVKVKDALLKAECLADCRQDVIDAGCEVHPEWANGAVLLMPLTELQAQDNQLELRPHHVVAFKGDKERVLAALQTLPCRSRPKIREEQGLPTRKFEASLWQPDADMILTVDRTFLTCLPAAPSECTAHESAPCGDANSKQPANPRKKGN